MISSLNRHLLADHQAPEEAPEIPLGYPSAPKLPPEKRGTRRAGTLLGQLAQLPCGGSGLVCGELVTQIARLKPAWQGLELVLGVNVTFGGWLAWVPIPALPLGVPWTVTSPLRSCLFLGELGRTGYSVGCHEDEIR